MQEGNAALARRDYQAAEAAAREVLARRGPRATDAQFLLAQAEMGSRNYQQAAPDFYDAYNRSRTGARAPDALLGVATALLALGDRQSACDALSKLRAEFPSAPGRDPRWRVCRSPARRLPLRLSPRGSSRPPSAGLARGTRRAGSRWPCRAGLTAWPWLCLHSDGVTRSD